MDNSNIVGLFGCALEDDSSSGSDYEEMFSSTSSPSSISPQEISSSMLLPPEDAEGNVEYKLKLVNPTDSRFEHLVTQMKWRLREGQGEAIYEIGVEDGGMVVGLSPAELGASLNTLYRMADKLGADVTILRERCVMNDRKAAEVLLRKVPENQQTIELRIAVLGNVDAGKSTLLGVLTQGELDNGRGRARLNLLRHLHEIQTGHTSSISREILGFNSFGQPMTYKQYRTAEEISDNSSKLITFIDLAGHQKYLKTTLFGLTGHSPHYVLLVVSAISGLTGTAQDHLALVMALQVPIIVVINKADMVSKNTLLNTLDQLEQLLKNCKKVPMEILGEDDALTAAQSLDSGTVCPIFMTSCVTGTGLNLLYTFLNVLPSRNSVKERECLMQLSTFFQIDETFDVPDVGLVAGGLLTQGVIRENDVLLAGPDSCGTFQQVRVMSVQRNRVTCRLVRAGESATLALDVARVPQAIRKGTVLCAHSGKPVAGRLFQAHIRVLNEEEPIRVGFYVTVQVGSVQQGAVVAGIRGRSELRSNDTGLILFRFVKQPECMSPGTRLLFHKGHTRGIGVLKKVYPLSVDQL